METKLNIRGRVGPALEIIGLNISKPLQKEEIDEINYYFLGERPVLIFKNQKLTEQNQVDFAKNFGTVRVPDKNRTDDLPDKHEAVTLVGNIHGGVIANGPLAFHSDGAFHSDPPKATLLYAVKIPKVGGNIIFTDIRIVYKCLPDYIKEKLNNCRSVNSFERRIDREAGRKGFSTEHPAVQTHPNTQEKVLYINELHTKELVPKQEDIFLPDLFKFIKKIEHCQTEYVYEEGDLVMWDNRSVQHARTDFSPDEERLLKRTTIY